MMSTTVVLLAVSTGVVVIAVAVAVVLVVLLVTVSMRGRQKRAAQRRGEARHDVDEARERAEGAERDRDIARGGGEDLSSER
jgi:Flp pilus assembly protein TadB